MKKISIQFHATCLDFSEFIIEMRKKEYIVYGLIFFPQFEIVEFTKIIKSTDIEKYNMLIISKSELQKEENYNTFIKKQDNNLGITIGNGPDDGLYESAMWIWSESEIDPDFKKIINSFKKKMNRGAWILNPYNNAKDYYKNHMYTDNAKLAYQQGVKIRPIAGCTLYELKKE